MGNPRKASGRGKGGGRGDGSGEEPLHAAARSGDLVAVQSIIYSTPLAVNSRDRHSRTPLHLAAWSGHTDVVSFLCKNKADVGAAAMDDMGAIHFASQKGHLDVVRVLLSSGVSVKATNRKGFTPLHYAAQGSHLNLIKYLVRKGANLSSKTKAGKTPLNLAENEEVRSLLEEHEKLVQKGEVEGSLQKISNTPQQDDQSNRENEEAMDRDNEIKLDGKEEEGEREKRKSEVTDPDKSSLKPKKAKVALGHLLAESDMPEEEE